jgi:hypothetical protein
MRNSLGCVVASFAVKVTVSYFDDGAVVHIRLRSISVNFIFIFNVKPQLIDQSAFRRQYPVCYYEGNISKPPNTVSLR